MKKKVTKPTLKARPSLTKKLVDHLLKKTPSSSVIEPLNPTIFEPKVQNRWICYVEDNDGKELIPSFLIRGVERPYFHKMEVSSSGKMFSVSPVLERCIPSSVAMPTNRIVYGHLTLNLYDPIKPSASKIVTDLINKNIRFTVRLVMLGPVGDRVEQWVYSGCKFNTLHFSTLNWGSNNEPATLVATLSVTSVKIS